MRQTCVGSAAIVLMLVAATSAIPAAASVTDHGHGRGNSNNGQENPGAPDCDGPGSEGSHGRGNGRHRELLTIAGDCDTNGSSDGTGGTQPGGSDNGGSLIGDTSTPVTDQPSPASVPEPASTVLMAAGLIAAFARS